MTLDAYQLGPDECIVGSDGWCRRGGHGRHRLFDRSELDAALERLKDLPQGRGAVMTPMPNQPKTPMRSLRVPDDLWAASKRRAEERGETLTAAIIRFLRRYSR